MPTEPVNPNQRSPYPDWLVKRDPFYANPWRNPVFEAMHLPSMSWMEVWQNAYGACTLAATMMIVLYLVPEIGFLLNYGIMGIVMAPEQYLVLVTPTRVKALHLVISGTAKETGHLRELLAAGVSTRQLAEGEVLLSARDVKLTQLLLLLIAIGFALSPLLYLNKLGRLQQSLQDPVNLAQMLAIVVLYVLLVLLLHAGIATLPLRLLLVRTRGLGAKIGFLRQDFFLSGIGFHRRFGIVMGLMIPFVIIALTNVFAPLYNTAATVLAFAMMLFMAWYLVRRRACLIANLPNEREAYLKEITMINDAVIARHLLNDEDAFSEAKAAWNRYVDEAAGSRVGFGWLRKRAV